jgi:hypothetical protein
MNGSSPASRIARRSSAKVLRYIETVLIPVTIRGTQIPLPTARASPTEGSAAVLVGLPRSKMVVLGLLICFISSK